MSSYMHNMSKSDRLAMVNKLSSGGQYVMSLPYTNDTKYPVFMLAYLGSQGDED